MKIGMPASVFGTRWPLKGAEALLFFWTSAAEAFSASSQHAILMTQQYASTATSTPPFTFGNLLRSGHGARNRARKLCQRVASKGRMGCRLHGGAAGSGAPKKAKGRYQHGKFTCKTLEVRAMIRELSAEMRGFAAGA